MEVKYKIKLTTGKDGDPSIIGNLTYRSLNLFHHEKNVGELKIKIEDSGLNKLFFAFKTYKFCVDNNRYIETICIYILINLFRLHNRKENFHRVISLC